MQVPIFYAEVKHGKLQHNNIERLQNWISKFEGKTVQITIKKPSNPKTLPQLKWLYGVAFKMLADWNGDDKEFWELYFKNLHCKEYITKEINGKTVEVTSLKSIAEMTTVEMMELMEFVVRHSDSEFGVYIPLPGEIDYTKINT